MARLIRVAIVWLLVIAIAAAAYFYARDYVRRHPQDVPWTALRLDQPVGLFTMRKLVALADRPAECRALLRQAQAGDVAAPPRHAGPDCGYAEAVRLVAAAGEARVSPAGAVAACPVAAALVVFERQVLHPAALEHFGHRIAQIEHAGTYSCRRRYGRAEGPYSEHARANAIDITGFALADGERVSVLRDWRSSGPKGAFLHDVRSGACRLFATTLSPDYNAAHADHLHLDQARRGEMGVGLCR